MESRCAHSREYSSSAANTMVRLSGGLTHMPLPDPRMLGNAVPDAQVSGNAPLMLLLLSAMMPSLGNALF